MREVDDWQTGVVTEPVWRVKIDGRSYDALSFNLGHEMSGGLPSQVVGGYALTASTAEVVFPPGGFDVISDGQVSPWTDDEWPPENGLTASVYAGFHETFVRVFTGQVLSSSGGTGKPLTVKLADKSERLHQRVMFPPIMSTGPRLDSTPEIDNYVSPGLTATYFLGQIAQWCGWHAVPDMVESAVMYATLNGSAYPRRGLLAVSERWNASSYDRWPRWTPSPWGQGTQDLNSTYLTDLGNSTGKVESGQPLKMSVIRGRIGTAPSSVVARWGRGFYYVSLDIDPDGVASIMVSAENSQWTSRAVQVGEDEVVVAEYDQSGDYRIRTSGGLDVPGHLSWVPRFGDTALDRVDVLVQRDGVQLGGAQVWFGPEWDPLQFERTAHLSHTSIEGTLQGTHHIDRQALSLFQEIGRAEIGATWLDADGHLHFRNRDALVESTPVATKTSLDDLLSYDWDISPDSVKSSTVVHYKELSLNRSLTPSITVWQGSGQTLEASEMVEDIIGPDADEEWVAVHTDLWSPWESAANFPSDFSRGRYSWAFGSDGTSRDDEDNTERYRSIDSTLTRISDRAYRLNQIVYIEARQVAPSTPTNFTRLPSRLHGEKMPIIRAKGHIRFLDVSETSRIEGPSWASQLEHDAGQWVQSRQNALRLADAIQDWVSEPIATIRDVRIHPDPRLELGDVIILRDSHVYHNTVKGLVSGINLSGDAGTLEMSLDLQVIDAENIPREDL